MEQKYNVIFIIGILWIFGTIGLALYIDVPSGSSRNLEIVKLIFLSIGAFGVISATLLNTFNSLESTRNIRSSNEFNKINNSYQFFERWDSPLLKASRDLTREYEENSPNFSAEDLKNKIFENKDLKRSVINEMNFWEEMYLSIEYGRVNEQMLREGFSKVYCKTYDTFKYSCKHLFQNNPTMRENLKILYNRWSK